MLFVGDAVTPWTNVVFLAGLLIATGLVLGMGWGMRRTASMFIGAGLLLGIAVVTIWPTFNPWGNGRTPMGRVLLEYRR